MDKEQECKMVGGENEIKDSVFCYYYDCFMPKDDCYSNCEHYLPDYEDFRI